MDITKEEAVRALYNIRTQYLDLGLKLKRRKWRASEKAMAGADYKVKIEAINMALKALGEPL